MIFLNDQPVRKRRRVMPDAPSGHERQGMMGCHINHYSHFAMDEFTPSELGEEYTGHHARGRGKDELYDSSASHHNYESDSGSHSANYSRDRSSRHANDEGSETSSSGTSSSEEDDEDHYSLPSISVINPTASPSRRPRDEIMNFRPSNQKPNIVKFESSMSQRLPGFLQEIAAANAQLQADIEAGKSTDHRIEISSEFESESDSSSDESSENENDNDANDASHSKSGKETVTESSAKSRGRKKRQYIEMNLALGVLEEKKDASEIKFRPDDDSSSTSSSDESIVITPRDRVVKKATGTKGKKLITEV